MMNNGYVIESTRRFNKDFESFERNLQDKIRESVRVLVKNPYAGKRLHGILKGFYSLRVGDYRVVYSVNESKNTVILYFIDHRKRVYEV